MLTIGCPSGQEFQSTRTKTVYHLLRHLADTEGKDGGSNRLYEVKELVRVAKRTEQSATDKFFWIGF